MNLPTFINELQTLAASLEHPESAEVTMADTIPVVRPVFAGGKVIITDEEEV